MTDIPTPAAGQVWVDNDPRIAAERGCDRLICITSVDDDGKATCEAWYDEGGSKSRTVRIRLDRFRPGRTGYSLISETVPVAGRLLPTSKLRTRKAR